MHKGFLHQVAFALLASLACTADKDIYYIVIMLPDLNYSNYPYMFGLQRVKPAIDIALEKVVHNTSLTSGFELVLRAGDSKCDISYSINEAFTFYMRKESTVFFGPCCDYAAAPIARQIFFWDIPMVTTGAMASGFSDKSIYGHLTRVGPTINSFINPIVAIMKEYGWGKLKHVYDPRGQSAVYRLCHFTADGLHMLLGGDTKHNISESHVKLMDHDYERVLKENIGKDNGSESCDDVQAVQKKNQPNNFFVLLIIMRFSNY